MRLSVQFALFPAVTGICLTSFGIFRVGLNWQVSLYGKSNAKTNPSALNWNRQLEISNELYFQNDLVTAAHFYFCSFEHNVFYTIQALSFFITFFFLLWFFWKQNHFLEV